VNIQGFFQIVLIMYNKYCQVSFFRKMAEMFSLLIFKDQELYGYIEAQKMGFMITCFL